MKGIILVCVLALLAGCATAPTPQELASLDYGAPISRDDAVAAVKDRVSQSLKDPGSATYQCGDIDTGWRKGNTALGGGLIAGYIINCAINAKNSFGGYVGAKTYQFLLHDGTVERIFEVLPDGSMIIDSTM